MLSACGGGGDAGEAPSTQAGSSAAAAEPAATPGGLPSWPAPPNPIELTREAGLEPGRRETLNYHVHSHLDVFVNGEPVLVPAGIGIDIANPGVAQGEFAGQPGYGSAACAEPCISPLHTHTVSGVVHTESFDPQPNRLGQFFTEWGVRLDESCVGDYCTPETSIAVYVDGQPYDGDPRDIALTDRKEIAIVIGTPPATIPASADFTLP